MMVNKNGTPTGAVIQIGTDIVECHRIAAMIERHAEQFLQRVFTQREICYCSSRKSSTQHYAGRWAAKESILKVLGTGWSQGVQWTDMEIMVEVGGKPYVKLTGQAAHIAASLGIREVLISISHCRAYAVAFATGVS
jgi:holo-[acyl-carrier protein] synthase